MVGTARCAVRNVSWWHRDGRRSAASLPCIGILSPHGERDSTAGGELRRDVRFPRRTGTNEIVQDAISDGFVKSAFVAEGSEVKLQRLALDAKFCWNVLDCDL